MTDNDQSDARGRAMTPEEEAALVVEMLDALEHSDTRHAKRLRSSLVAVIDDFRARRERGDDLEAVKARAARRLVVLETRAAELIAKSVWKVHDRAVAESLRLGDAGPEGLRLRTRADSLGLYAEALEQLADAGRLADPALRERALALVARARSHLPPPPAGPA